MIVALLTVTAVFAYALIGGAINCAFEAKGFSEGHSATLGIIWPITLTFWIPYGLMKLLIDV